MLQKFWMIIRHDSLATHGRYYEKEEAEIEIERLVKQENKPFILLEAMECCEQKGLPVIWHGMREAE